MYKTKVDIIYEKLLVDIENGRYEPGERLIIGQISKENNTSDIPVREAIRRLESERYLDVSANHGASVYNFAPEVVFEIFEIKAVLEGFASCLAIDVLQEEDYVNLRGLNDKMLAEYQAGNAAGCADCNMEFHMYIYRHLNKNQLSNMIEDLWRKYRITKKVFQVAPGHPLDSYKEHEEILQLMENKQYQQVEDAVRAHKIGAGQQLLVQMKKEEHNRP